MRKHLFQETLAGAETVSEMNWEGRRSQGRHRRTVAPFEVFGLFLFAIIQTKWNVTTICNEIWALLQFWHTAALPPLAKGLWDALETKRTKG